MVMSTFTAYIGFDEETKVYVGIVPVVPGAHIQAVIAG
jgi:predicted RNase H-like HicB family nuclease